MALPRRQEVEPTVLREGHDLLAFESRLPASVLNVEAKSRSNLFPWRGQFSPQFVEAILRSYAPPDAVVLDPFMGSGTVLVECARRGLAVHGCEVNPAAYLLGRVYELCRLAPAARRKLLVRVEEALARIDPDAFDLPLFRLCKGAASPELTLAAAARASRDPAVSTLLTALVVLLDDSSEQAGASRKAWSSLREIVLGLPETVSPIEAGFGDARRLRLEPGSIDFVLTSPPYVNVFNYHHNSRSAIEALGWEPLVVARSEIGSNRKFRQNRFLTVVQYCIDMAQALAELQRVCRSSARIVLVLGRESNVHKTPFYNGRILETLATKVVGLRLCLEQERVFTNRFGQRIYEDIFHLIPALREARANACVIEGARATASRALVDALGRVPDDRRHFLEEAIDRAGSVEPSPILIPRRAAGED